MKILIKTSNHTKTVYINSNKGLIIEYIHKQQDNPGLLQDRDHIYIKSGLEHFCFEIHKNIDSVKVYNDSGYYKSYEKSSDGQLDLSAIHEQICRVYEEEILGK